MWKIKKALLGDVVGNEMRQHWTSSAVAGAPCSINMSESCARGREFERIIPEFTDSVVMIYSRNDQGQPAILL